MRAKAVIRVQGEGQRENKREEIRVQRGGTVRRSKEKRKSIQIIVAHGHDNLSTLGNWGHPNKAKLYCACNWECTS